MYNYKHFFLLEYYNINFQYIFIKYYHIKFILEYKISN